MLVPFLLMDTKEEKGIKGWEMKEKKYELKFFKHKQPLNHFI